MKKLFGFLRLARPANIVTAFSDIGAGVCMAYFGIVQQLITDVGPGSGVLGSLMQPSHVLLLLLSTLGLYGGGVVMNDVFDAKLDAVERPERPIPSGLISKTEAAAWGAALLLFGIICAALVHWPNFFSTSFFIAVAIAAAALLYDAWGKHQSFFGPVNMGICRGLNLLLGISIMPEVVTQFWPIALVPVVYIAAITMVSRGEVHGGKRGTMYTAALLYAIVITAIAVVAFFKGTILTAIPFLLLFGAVIFPPLFKAIKAPIGPNIGKAVKSGVLALILMNAAWAAAFDAPVAALCMLLLLPLSLWLAKAFAVT